MFARTVIMAMAVVSSTFISTVSASDEEPSEACVNYGVQNSIAVIGDSEISCVAQYCYSGPTGAASVGTGVGVNAGEGEAGASATAGAGCSNTVGNGTRFLR